MRSQEVADETRHAEHVPWRLFVAWQDPESRAITPVGRLERDAAANSVFMFTYLRSATNLKGFRPFVNFPDLYTTYSSPELFPFFENRLMPRKRADYFEYLETLALSAEADPFEVLARSGGRKATDTVEVFPEPIWRQGRAETRFLVRLKYVEHAEEVAQPLVKGDRLWVMHDLQNDYDQFALMLRTDNRSLVGFIPAYLSPMIHESFQGASDRDAIRVEVEHVGDRQSHLHRRLLCRLTFPWKKDRPFFGDPSFEPIGKPSDSAWVRSQ